MSANPEWKQVNDTEFLLGENRIRLIYNKIIYIEVVGEQTDEHARLIRENYARLLVLANGRIKQLVNLNKSGKSSSLCRAVFRELNDESVSEKVAVYGLHPVAKVLASFVIGFQQHRNIRFFTDEKEALKWLMNSEP
jgi:hypothetical protein